MSLKIKIDLKKQKIFNSSNMSDKEDHAKGDTNDLSQAVEATSASASVMNESAPEIITADVAEPPLRPVLFSKNPSAPSAPGDKTHHMAMAFAKDHSAECVSDVDDPPAMEAISDGDDLPVMEAISDADEPPVMEAVSDADDAPPLIMEAVSDADDPPVMEALSDADDEPPFVMEAVDGIDSPVMEAVDGVDSHVMETVDKTVDGIDSPVMEAIDSNDSRVMEAVSDADELPEMEAVSDADDPPAMEAVSDADDPPAMDAVSDADDPPAMEAASDADESSASDVDNPPEVKSVSDNLLTKEADSSGAGASPNKDIGKGNDNNSVDCAGAGNGVNASDNKNGSENVSSSETLFKKSEDGNCENQKGENLDSKDTDVVKNVENGSEKGRDTDTKHSASPAKKVQESSSPNLKTSVAAPNVRAEFSDTEENMELPPQNKLLEVIFKEDDDENNVDAFVPEVECSVSEDKGELSATQDNGDSGSRLSTEEDTVLTPLKDDSAAVEDTKDSTCEKEAVRTPEEEDASASNTVERSAESCDVDETMQTYAKEFLYSDTSSLGPEHDGNDDGKRTSLGRIPKIAKNVGSADYSLIQEMYKLLYLRNPWDTKEVLSARILDFSGFHFADGSEDYFNREVILRGMPQKTLESIANLLAFSKPVSARSNKQRTSLSTRIMKFLKSPEKPKRNRPPSKSKARSITALLAQSMLIKPLVFTESPSESATPAKSSKPRSRKSTPSRSAPKVSKKEPEVKVKVEQEGASVSSATERHFSPGKMKWSDLALPEVKVAVTKIQLSDINKVEKLREIELNDIRKAAKSKAKVRQPSAASMSSASGSSSSSNSKPFKIEDASKAGTSTSTPSESVPDEEIKKLKEFPEVLSYIEGTPEKILSDIHYLLYLEDASMKDLKSNVMEFRGFPVEDGPTEVEERKQFLEKMSEEIIKNIVSMFYLKCSNDKEENINSIIKFLKAPSKRHMKEADKAPDQMLPSEKNTDLMEGLSDSDDSITCEIVHKKVDCIDLISSGEEDEKEEEEKKVVIKKEELPGRPEKRCLHDFETITKIVNTHPHEYLIDIYNLLFQHASEPSTLRKEILEFTGFEFEKGSDEYVKRKQYLDRMQYNNVRRIFNTLIHNTRDVRVFSKPTMIAEIFQFLFKLPDTDTSVRPPPQKSGAAAALAAKEKEKEKAPVTAALANVVNKADSSQASSNTRLSELKRVFQRVACFPCEYLVDVHKLLFMKDCDMKDIRQNIFAFKGFTFGVDSQEFKQRKMYLEYLTFHSLRKISSVLTTKNVDLRNSTKHELSTHLTKVLTEYTNTFMEAEAQEASSKAEEITAQANKAAAVAAQDPSIEKIIVTPVIEGFQAASTNDSSLPKVVDIRSQSKVVSPKSKSGSSGSNKGNTISMPSTSQQPPRKKAKKSSGAEKPITQTFEKIIIPTVDKPPTERRRKKANPMQKVSEEDALTKAEQMGAAMQFQDIHLPEVENLVRSYQQNPNLMSTLLSRQQATVVAPVSLPNPTTTTMAAMDTIRTNYRAVVEQKSGGQNIASHFGTTQFPLQMLYPQIRQTIAPPNVTIGLPPRPTVPFQIIRPFSMQPPIQTMYYNQSILNSSSPPLEPIYKDDEPGDYVGTLPVECILTEDGSGEPASKKPKLAQLLTAPQSTLTQRHIPQPTQSVQPMKKPNEKAGSESGDSSVKPSTSFHLKIRDAMTKASEDEEDCDKPLATLVGHPNDKVLKQQICEIVENTDLQDITINGVIQKIFSMYPKFNLNYRKEFIKSTLRSLLYRLGEQDASKSTESDSNNPDSSVSASDQGDSAKTTKVPASWSTAASNLSKS